MQCYNTTIEWIDCKMLTLDTKCCAVQTRVLGTNIGSILRICNLSTTVFIHLNPFAKLQLFCHQMEVGQHSDSPPLSYQNSESWVRHVFGMIKIKRTNDRKATEISYD